MALKDKHWFLIAFAIVAVLILMNAKAQYQSSASISDASLGVAIASNAWA